LNKRVRDIREGDKMEIALKRILILFSILFITHFCYAGPPFGTDDPEPVDFKHWEYYLSSMNTFQPGFMTGTLPHAEINYGIIPGGQFHMELPMNYNLIQHKEFQYGYSNTELGFKYRFFQSKDKSIQIGSFPIFEVPTIKNNNFSSNNLQVYIPVWFQKSWNKLTTYGGCGYWINPGTNNKNWLFTGWEIQYDFSRHFTLGGELFYRTPSNVDSHSFIGINLGGFVNFSDKLHFIYSFGHSITKDKSFMSYIGFLVTI
jgi:hypothetical protein